MAWPNLSGERIYLAPKPIQYAVEALWPTKKKANAAIRVEFKLSPNRALA